MSTDRELSGDAARLYELMSDISEDCWCAGWMSGNEYSLWKMVSNPVAERNYGFGYVDDDQVAEMKALAERCDGWVIWWDDDCDPNAPIEEWGARLMPMADWLKRWGAFTERASTAPGRASKPQMPKQ